jgi:hypothetical protein
MTELSSGSGPTPAGPASPPHDAAGAPPPQLDAAVPPPSEPPPEPQVPRDPFPFMHLLMALLYIFIGTFVFWFVIFLAFLQYVTIAIQGHKNEELQQFSRQTTRYMQELLDYVTLARETRPFPLGPFPKE